MKALPLLAALLLAPATADAEAIRWTNGKWFDGARFVEKTFYSIDGNLRDDPPDGTPRTIDLGGRYVVPAFGDAHHHGIDREDGLDAKVAAFLRDGIFYVKNPNVVPSFLTPGMRAQLNTPRSVDVVFSNGGLTSSGAHPGPLHEKLAEKGVFPGYGPGSMEGHAYFNIDSKSELDAKWPSILEGRPDFIKVFLNGIEDLLPRTAGDRPAIGLEAGVLAAVVDRTHAAGLRVSAHVDTAADVEKAVRTGVDELNHMPVLEPIGDAQELPDPAGFLVAPSVAAIAAKQGTFVVATASAIPRLHGARWHREVRDEVIAHQRTNLRTLLAAGVRVAIASDGISGEEPFITARSEVDYLHRNGLVDPLTLLKMWSENTPATIFPDRRIGRLSDGYEANFLVLEGDPISDFANVSRIWLRVKRGECLAVAGLPAVPC